jgi:hypothetical protein
MISLAATGGGGAIVGGGIDPTNSQTGTGRTWFVSTTLRLIYSQERPSTEHKGGWMCFVACLGGRTVSNITGRTFSKQQTEGPSISYVAHFSIGNASLQLQECYLVLLTRLCLVFPSRAENLIVRSEICVKSTVCCYQT